MCITRGEDTASCRLHPLCHVRLALLFMLTCLVLDWFPSVSCRGYGTLKWFCMQVRLGYVALYSIGASVALM